MPLPNAPSTPTSLPQQSSLSQEHCEPCQVDAPMISDKELPVLLDKIPNWHTKKREGILQLERQYNFKNFIAALSFANCVGELAEQANHHPVILVEWGKVTVTWWTHKIGGLHHNDFIMAARTDLLV